MISEPKVLWEPDSQFIRRSEISHFVDWLNEEKGVDFQISDVPMENVENYKRLWKWSVDNLEGFWESVWHYFGIKSHTNYTSVLDARRMPGARWFTGSTLNFAEHAFLKSGDGEALVYVREDGVRRSLSWSELRNQVGSFAAWLRKVGVRKGDRVVAYCSQVPEAVIALLASASLGAVWAATGSELSPRAVIDRFKQLDPKILVFSDGFCWNGQQILKLDHARSIIEAIPSIERAVLIPNITEGGSVDLNRPLSTWSETTDGREDLRFEPVPFDHPLWVLNTSGTTGIPKPIVHGHGGIILEMMKAANFHLGFRSGERVIWFSTPTWMMWNAVICSLMTGTTVVFYDGSPLYKGMTPLWEVCEKERINFFGTSAPFLHGCMKIGLEPGSVYNLKHLKGLGSTAAPLSPEGYEWVYRRVKDDIWLNSASGGTDVMSAFLGGCPVLPVWSGELQCRWLGVKVESYNTDGKPVVNELGELVIELPMPSMPLFFWGDDDFKWYKESYFSMFPNVWWHGDWVIITERGTAIITGRSDSTIKRKGVRMGTLDFYKVIEAIDEVVNSMIVEVKGKTVLFVVLKPGFTLTEELKIKINNTLKERLGPYFLADRIIQVQDIPLTLNYKKVEVPVKKILLGWELEKAVRLDSLLNPDAFLKLIEAVKPYMDELRLNHEM